MTVIAFPVRPPTPFEAYRLRVTLCKNGHRWFYEITPLGQKGQTWVRIDRQTTHRAQITTEPRVVRMLMEQYQREIAMLAAYGCRHE